jgi:OmpA-OmpF porin, OOP family
MKKIAFVLLVLMPGFTMFSQEDAQGCKDNPMFNRMPHVFISECSKNYDQLEVPMAIDKTETLEGTKTTIHYVFNRESSSEFPSFFQIVKNHENAIIKSGGKKVYYNKEQGVATFFAKSGGKDIWVLVNDFSGVGEGNYGLTTLEMEGMKQDISASEMLEAINKNGSIALYINFETGKSDIKAESQKIIDDIAAMLKDSPALKVSIQGHTDNVGNAAANQTLSENRAKSVMNAVIAKGTDKTRLSAKGHGQTKPLADNGTEDGKAKNRRVEIVKQ